MTIFEDFKSKNIDNLAEWLDKYGALDAAPWTFWFDNNYCKKCEVENGYIEELHRECECNWCELHGKCKYFEELEEVPNNKLVIKMWLELESEDEQYEI